MTATLQDIRPIPIDTGLERFGFPLAKNQEQVVTLAADLNRDGIEDLIVGAPFSDGAAQTSGTVTVFRGVFERGELAHYPWYWFGQSY